MNAVQVRKCRLLCVCCSGPFLYSFSVKFSSLQALLVGGYISQTFRSRAAEQYFLDLLKSTSLPPHAALSCAGREGYFLSFYSVLAHIPAQLSNPPGR